MAEKTFRRMLADRWIDTVTVDSAGTAAMPHYAIVGVLKDVMDEKNVDYFGHIPKMVDDSLLSSSDIVIVMAAGHLNYIRMMYPEYADRTYLISSYAQGLDKDVPDPIGCGKDVYVRVFEEIAGYLEKIMEKITNGTKNN